MVGERKMWRRRTTISGRHASLSLPPLVSLNKFLAAAAMPIVQFTPLSSLVQPAFWHALTDLKIDVLRLSDDAVPLSASYTAGRAVHDRETGADIALGCNLSIGGDAFLKSQQ